MTRSDMILAVTRLHLGRPVRNYDEILAQYARADFIVIRCHNDLVPFTLSPSELESKQTKSWLEACGGFDRLLSTGEWQSADERRGENLAQLGKVK